MARRRSRSRSRHQPEKAAVNKFESDWAQRPTRRPIPEAEKLLLTFLIGLSLALPWAIGSAHLWTQAGAALLAFVCFILALIPHDFNNNPEDTAIRRLVRFPFFWLGLALLLYVGLQAFNPAYRVERADSLVWLDSLEPLGFLPSGVAASFFEQGTVRSLLVLLIPFFGICAMWAGLTRRRSVYILLWALVLNGLSLAGLAILQAYTRTPEVLWLVTPNEGEPFVSSFLHAPHAAAFFLALIGPALGFCAHYYFQSKRTFERSSPSGLFAFCGIVFVLMLLFSYQPIAAAAAGFLMLFLLYFILHRELLTAIPRFQQALIFALGLVVMSIGGAIAWNVSSAHAERRAAPPLEALSTDHAVEDDADNDSDDSEAEEATQENPTETAEEEPSGETGIASEAPEITEPEFNETEAAWELLQDNWLFGAGLGSLAYLLPEYGPGTIPEGAENPHRVLVGNDWIRFPAELGLAGTLLLIALILSLFIKVFRRRLVENPIPLFILLALVAVLLLAGTRVIFDNPAVLFTWLGLLTVAALIIRIETSRVVPESKSGLRTDV